VWEHVGRDVVHRKQEPGRHARERDRPAVGRECSRRQRDVDQEGTDEDDHRDHEAAFERDARSVTDRQRERVVRGVEERRGIRLAGGDLPGPSEVGQRVGLAHEIIAADDGERGHRDHGRRPERDADSTVPPAPTVEAGNDSY
jgi:hypothetical protein